jgi:hypothetical protein
MKLVLDILAANPQQIMRELGNIQKTLDLSRRYATTIERKRNINKTKGLIQYYVAKKDGSTIGQGAELIQTFNKSLLCSRI